MANVERHEMQLEVRYGSGAQAWRCTQCARHIVLQHDAAQSQLKIIELEMGDRTALHRGVAGGLSIRTATTSEEKSAHDPANVVPPGYRRH